MSAERWELYRLLAEPVRLRLLALAAEEELAVGELAELLGEGQPNVSRHAAPLRQAGLVVVRKEGTRALVRLAEGVSADPVIADALTAGRALCREDGSLSRVREVVRARDAQSRAFFARESQEGANDVAFPHELGAYLAALAPLIPHRRLAVDAGTGDGGLLEVLARVFDHVVAFDREEAQLFRCARRLEARGFDNVDLLQGEVGSASVTAKIGARGGADVVFASRFLHHAPQPAAALQALTALARPDGAVVVVDYAPHEDESMREQADLWLGFDEAELRRLARGADLVDVVVRALPAHSPHGSPNSHNSHNSHKRSAPDAHLAFQVMVGRRASNAAPPAIQHDKPSKLTKPSTPTPRPRRRT